MDAKWHKNGLDYKDKGDYTGGDMVVGWMKKVKNTEIRDLGGDGQEDEQAGADGLIGLSIEFCVWFSGPEEL